MKYLIIGGGSAGARHYQNLKELGVDVYMQSAHLGAEGIKNPDAVIIANETRKHVETALMYPNIPKLIEKPLSHNLDGTDEISGDVLVGYQWRFDPSIKRLKDKAKDMKRVTAHMGQHIADWHPWEDWRRSYACIDGAMLTLSHPLDYCLWMFGDYKIKEVALIKGNRDIQVNDRGFITLKCGEAIVHIEVNMYERPESHFFLHDGNYIEIQKRPKNFVEEASHFVDIVERGATPICSLEDGRRVIRIATAEAICGMYCS